MHTLLLSSVSEKNPDASRTERREYLKRFSNKDVSLELTRWTRGTLASSNRWWWVLSESQLSQRGVRITIAMSCPASGSSVKVKKQRFNLSHAEENETANKRSSAGRRAECQRRREKCMWDRRERETESEKEKTQKCGPPGLDADTSEGLLRGGARPYGCMAKWNPRGGSGHISLHAGPPSLPLHCGLRDAQEHWQWHQALPPLWWLLDPPELTPAGKRPGAEKNHLLRHREHRVTYATQ